MATFHLPAQLIHHFFQRLYITGEVHILLVEYVICSIYDPADYTDQNLKFRSGLRRETEILFVKLSCGFHNIYRMT